MAEPLQLALVGCEPWLGKQMLALKVLADHGCLTARLAALGSPGCDDAAHRLARFGDRAVSPRGTDLVDTAHVCASDLQAEPPRRCDTWGEVLEQPELGAVLLDWRAEGAADLASLALQRGLHVLAAPAPLAAPDGSEGRFLALEPERFEPVALMARWCLDQGALGPVRWAAAGRVLPPHGLTPAAAQAALRDTLAQLADRCGPVARLSAQAGADGLAWAAQVEFASGALGLAAVGPGLAGAQPPAVHGTLGSLVGSRLVFAGATRPVAGWFRAHAEPAERERVLPYGLLDARALALHAAFGALAGCPSGPARDDSERVGEALQASAQRHGATVELAP